MSNASIKEKLTHVPETVLFLGAGASYPLGYPPTREFVTNFMADLKKNGKSNEAYFLDSILKRINENMDIEQVLELVEALENSFNSYPTEPFFRTHTTVINIGGTNWELPTLRSNINSLIQEIEKEVFEVYRWKPAVLNKAKELYEPFFNLVKNRLSNDKQLFIFTTNYDKVIEEVGSALKEYEVVDGFTIVKNKHLWNPQEELNKESTSVSLIKLFKLHGSLSWRERTDNKFERVGVEERTLGNQTYKRNVLIYPTLTHKANHMVEYLSELYDLFRVSMERTHVCIVVGYSFRDENINNILSGFRNRKGTMLVAVSPSAEKNLRKNLLKETITEEQEKEMKKSEQSDIIDKNKGKITMINRKFGEQKTLEEIDKTLKHLKI